MPESVSPTGEWIVQVDEDESNERRFGTRDALIAFFEELASRQNGRVAIWEDTGPRPRRERLLGLGERLVVPRLAMEWDGVFASLIFLDDAASEYRALDREHPVRPGEDIRRRIAHGELRPHPEEECMETPRAWEAARQFIRDGGRPRWLSYRYVR